MKYNVNSIINTNFSIITYHSKQCDYSVHTTSHGMDYHSRSGLVAQCNLHNNISECMLVMVVTRWCSGWLQPVQKPLMLALFCQCHLQMTYTHLTNEMRRKCGVDARVIGLIGNANTF